MRVDTSDEILIGRTSAGDRRAFDELVSRHQASLFRFARAITRSAEQAEDVLQETFLAAFRAAASFRGESSVRSWLLTIARNKAKRLGRPRAGQPQTFETLEQLGQQAGWGADDDPEVAAMAAEDRERLAGALDGLSEEDRELLVLRELEGLSGEQAAAVLGLSLAAQKSRLHRARLRFAAAGREFGGESHGP